MNKKPIRNDWDIRDDYSTIQRAAAIQKDKGRMGDVQKLHESVTKMLTGGPVKSAPAKIVSKPTKSKK